jgi:hypothetical protein
MRVDSRLLRIGQWGISACCDHKITGGVQLARITAMSGDCSGIASICRRTYILPCLSSRVLLAEVRNGTTKQASQRIDLSLQHGGAAGPCSL